MEQKDKIWIKSMEFFCKYWGCHQMPERSFFIGCYQFPVCARCTGIMIGYILSLLTVHFFDMNILVLLIMCAPMALDGGIQYLTKYRSNNFRRIITGLLYGYGFLGFWLCVLKHIF